MRFHVHHGVEAEQYRCANLRDLVRFVYAIEDYFIAHCRRQERKDTCRPMDLDTKAFSRSPAAR